MACVLLLLVIAFLLVNPLWECHDHLDNLRHMGPHGVLMLFLLFACAGITLFTSLRWFNLGRLRIVQLIPQCFAAHRLTGQDILPSTTFFDLPLPLRI
ncbi:MAG: hypothetical protein ACYC46_05075 [Acidobacteriaceae bacterium]